MGRLVKEWQQRNEKYQSEDWWQAQLLSDDEDEESLAGRGCERRPLPEDLESVTSADVRAVTQGIRRTKAESVSSVSTDTSSFADMWKQRLKEIEEQAAARYRKRGQGDENEAESEVTEDDVESVMSECGSLYNFCKKNKETLTPLERWRIKRIQFGWLKKDSETEPGAGADGEGEAQDAKVPALEDVNLTAYQSWKLRQQKRLGNEDKDAIVELSRAQDAAVARRRQRREEVLERSRRTLEESQSSSSGWDTESTVSGSTIPLSAFWQLASAQSPAPDDSASMLSGHTSISRARSTRSSASAQAPPQAPPTPMVPLPNLQGQGNEAVDLLSIQNWIANVVTETLNQKQGEMLMGGGSLPPSRAGSVLSLGTRSGRPTDDDKASMLSGASYTSGLSRGAGESVLSAGGTSNYSGYGSRKAKITKTSVPLYSLFQDQVDLRKLDSMDKEMKSEMRGKMASYELQKIATDNKRSTLFKKKKTKEDSDEEAGDDAEGMQKAASKYSPDPDRIPTRDLSHDPARILSRNPISDPAHYLAHNSSHNPARDSSCDPTRDRLDRSLVGSTGKFGVSTAEKDKVRSIDKWLSDIRAPSQYTSPGRAVPGGEVTEPEYEFCSRGRVSDGSFQSEEDYASSTVAEEDFSSCSFSGYEDEPSSELPYRSKGFPPSTDTLSNTLEESQSYRAQRRCASEEKEGGEEARGSTAKRTFSHDQDPQAQPRRGGRGEEEEDEEVSAFISRCRQRSKMLVEEEELDEDDVVGAWRRQQAAKRRVQKESDS